MANAAAKPTPRTVLVEVPAIFKPAETKLPQRCSGVRMATDCRENDRKDLAAI
jgi:hypothetical protein